jgi:ATP-dependent DNA helicase RecQ
MMEISQSRPWYEIARERARTALRASVGIGDRGAMLRELCRLHGGYLDCSVENGDLRATDLPHLARFGLKHVPLGDGQAVMIDDTNNGPLIGPLADVLRVDPSARQIYPPESADALLLKHSGFKTYRAPTQKAAVRALATMPDGATLLVTLPTGAGKSLLFQLAPSLAHEAGACCVVIVPTVALALAHVEGLRSIAGLETSDCIHADQSPSARTTIYDAFARGEIPVLVLSPEVALGDARELLVETARPPERKLPGLNAQITMFFVDEAHIVESWGRTFRPDFQRLPGLVDALRQANPSLRTVLLSATVNDAARAELKRAYGSNNFLAVEAKVARYEFDLVHIRIETAAERDVLLVELVDQLPRPAIVYTTLVQHAETLHRAIKARGYERLAVFTGQLEENSERLKIVSGWRAGDIDLVVATSAFGMGIDKDDVRAVIHACVPESPSRYYQEIGRAARDGNQALALMLWTDDRGKNGDWRLARRLWSGSWLTPDMMRKRWRAIMCAAQHLGRSAIIGSAHRLVVSLDAFHDDLPRGDTDYNRDWNRSLLNMLQRAGAITIMATDRREDVPVWHVDIREPVLLAEHSSDAYWDHIASLRSGERDSALADLDQFKAALFNPTTCVLAAIFELVEAGNPLVSPCGRCAFCRDEGIAPPRVEDIRFEGLDRTWPAEIGKTVLRQGISLVHPTIDDSTIGANLVDGLVGAGIEQFILPDRHADVFAERLRAQHCRFGLVSSHSDILGHWRPARLPTVLFIEDQNRVDQLLERLRTWHATCARLSLVIVAPARIVARGKPIAQILSSSAPIAENALHRFAKEISAR